jgi:hypothetical protein
LLNGAHTAEESAIESQGKSKLPDTASALTGTDPGLLLEVDPLSAHVFLAI